MFLKPPNNLTLKFCVSVRVRWTCRYLDVQVLGPSKTGLRNRNMWRAVGKIMMWRCLHDGESRVVFSLLFRKIVFCALLFPQILPLRGLYQGIGGVFFFPKGGAGRAAKSGYFWARFFLGRSASDVLECMLYRVVGHTKILMHFITYFRNWANGGGYGGNRRFHSLAGPRYKTSDDTSTRRVVNRR